MGFLNPNFSRLTGLLSPLTVFLSLFTGHDRPAMTHELLNNIICDAIGGCLASEMSYKVFEILQTPGRG